MNKTKKVLFASSCLLLGATLASCKTDTRNQNVPLGSISASKTVATLGDITVSEKELYNNLRYNYGVEVFNKKIENLIFGDELGQVQYSGDTKIEIDKLVAEAVYQTSDLTELSLKKADDLDLARKKYVDTMSRQGVTVTENELIFDEITKQTENISFSNLSDTIKKHYSASSAKKIAGKNYINAICDDEYLEEDGKLTKNNYYISEDDIEARYESNYRKYNTSTGIILRFTSRKQAEDAIKKINGSNKLNKDTIKEDYVTLFNNYYNYEDDKLVSSAIGTNEKTIFKTNDDVQQLASYSADLEKLFLEELENGEGLLSPLNIGDKYYLIYRNEVTYRSGSTEDIPYAKLTEKLGKDKVAEIEAEVKEDIIDAKSEQAASEVYQDELEALDIKIYDPYIENSFAGSNSFYEYVTSIDTNYIFAYKDGNYSVADFYNDLKKYDITNALVDIVTDKYLTKNHSNYLEKNDDLDERQNVIDEVEADIKEFKKGNKTLNKEYGEQNYLFYNYGYLTKDEVINSKLADLIKTDYLADIISNNWATADHKINDETTTILNNLIISSEELLKEKKLFDLNIDHILISVDNDYDGNPDNMLDFTKNLSDAQNAEFEKAVYNLTKAIVEEVEKIDRDNTVEKLNYVVDAYNRGLKRHDGTSWDELKVYNFVLKAETLGDVDESSVNSYVEEFKEYVELLFDKAVKEELEIDEDKEKDGRLYFATEGVDTTNFAVKDLCLTEFGYHMLSLNSYEKDSTELKFSFKEEQDSSGDYRDIKVILDEKDKDDKNDDIYIVTDIYNTDSTKPSLNQVLVYYVEKANGDVTSIKTSIKNSLSTLLDEAINKYTSSSFQEYLLLQTITKDLVINEEYNTIINTEDFLEYKKNSIENYDTESYFYQNWYNDETFNWSK